MTNSIMQGVFPLEFPYLVLAHVPLTHGAKFPSTLRVSSFQLRAVLVLFAGQRETKEPVANLRHGIAPFSEADL